MDPLDLDSFLKLGYFLRYRKDPYPFDLSPLDPGSYAGATEHDLVRVGVERLKQAIAGKFVAGHPNVIPLSGGLDSRAILAVLLECTEAANLTTYTFGAPGSFDYEIGCQVASQAGTRHVAMSLDEHRYTLDELMSASRRVQGQTFLFHHPPLALLDEVVSDGRVWSGYIGDFFVGSHLPRRASASIDEARSRFLAEDRYVRSMELGRLPDEMLLDHVDTPRVEYSGVTLDEQIFALNHIRKNTAPHVLLDGYEYVTPFLDRSWTGFALGLATRHRSGMTLWKKILMDLSPRFFSMAIKSHHGLPLTAGPIRIRAARALRRVARGFGLARGVDPKVNYLDWNEALRTRDDLKGLVRGALADLRARGLVDWVDLDDLWTRHQLRGADLADALIVLTSLEIHLQTRSADGGQAA